MALPFQKFGFAGVVLALVVLAGAAVGVKMAFDAAQGGGAGPSGGPPQAQAGAPGQGGGARPPGGGRPGGDAARVVLETAQVRPLYDIVQALGTAQARESVTITSKVTDVIQSIRFDSGDRVSRGQVLVVLASVEQQADLAEAKAQRDAAKREAERFAELGARGFAPAARVEETRAAYDRALARVSALESRIADRTIRAPFAGVIGLRTASPGALARPGDPIATLDDIAEIKLDFDVPESQIAQVTRGAEIEARSAALGDRLFKGRVEDLDSRLNTTSRTLRARAVLANPDGALKPGMLLTVNVRFNPREALSVAEIALLERSDGLFVYRADAVEGRRVAALASVRVGRRVDGRAEILSGLKAGDVVVVEGVQRIRPGQSLQDVAAAASAPQAGAQKTGGPPGASAPPKSGPPAVQAQRPAAVAAPAKKAEPAAAPGPAPGPARANPEAAPQKTPAAAPSPEPSSTAPSPAPAGTSNANGLAD